MAATDEMNDIVVALPHLGPVLDALAQARGTDTSPLSAEPITSDVLGLARIPLLDVERAARSLWGWYETPGPTATLRAPQPPSGEQPALDRVLWALRAGFGMRYCNWMPTMGKNRAVGQVHGKQAPGAGVTGAGEVSHGGGGTPEAVKAEPGWATQATAAPASGVQVGLVDTGMATHDYLTGVWTGPYVAGGGEPTYAEHGHATFIAGLIHRHAPGATLRVHPVLDAQGTADSWSAAHKIVEAGRAGAHVLNLSFVCYTEDGHGPLVLATALDRLDPATVVVAAAGNHGYLRDGRQYKPAWPAAFPDVIAVGAARGGSDHEPAPFTPKGPWIDVLAPGEHLESTYLRGSVLIWRDPDGPGPALPKREVEEFRGFARWSGTSFAAGVVSALIAERTEPGRTTSHQAVADVLTHARAEELGLALPSPHDG